MSPNTRKDRAIWIVLDVVILLTVLILGGLLGFDKLGIKPTVRGFFCDDQSLMYPYRPDTVSTELVVVLCILLPPMLMAVIEGVHHYQSRQNEPGWNYLTYATACYKTMGFFLFGSVLTQILGEIGKLVVGRLRPHFFDVCKPDYSKIACFSNNFSVYVNVDDQYCTGTDLSLITDARNPNEALYPLSDIKNLKLPLLQHVMSIKRRSTDIMYFLESDSCKVKLFEFATCTMKTVFAYLYSIFFTFEVRKVKMTKRS